MIKFFRKISYDHMEKQNWKVFKYVVGKIILVIIGVLIALEVNNWNEENKLKNEEIKILNNFKSVIEDDLIKLDTQINSYYQSRNSINYLIS
jgi:hypothetical protein